jgi:hypothetical protein
MGKQHAPRWKRKSTFAQKIKFVATLATADRWSKLGRQTDRQTDR